MEEYSTRESGGEQENSFREQEECSGAESAAQNSQEGGQRASSKASYDPGYVKREKQRSGVGGYVLTGVLCLLLGMAMGGCTAAVVISGVSVIAKNEHRMENFSPSNFGDRIEEYVDDFINEGNWGDVDFEYSHDFSIGEHEDEEYQEPEYKERVERELPEFDGSLPNIVQQNNPVPDIVQHVYDGVVCVNMYSSRDGDEYLSGYGSGFVVSSEGYILTNYHVVRDAVKVTVTFSDGEEVDAEFIGGDVNTDTAVLTVQRKNLVPLAIGNSDDLRVGEFTLAIGNPSGANLTGSASFGIISATSRSINVDGRDLNMIQTDAAVNLGSSGGPLLNMNGQVIGITTAKHMYAGYDEYGYAMDAEGLGFAIPINDAMQVVEQIITRGYVARAGLGVNVIGIGPEEAEYYDIPEGIIIYSVTKNGPAHKAGIKVDDVVLDYDGITASSQEEFVKYVKGMEVGESISIRIWRNGEELELDVVLGDMNQMSTEIVGNRVSELLE